MAEFNQESKQTLPVDVLTITAAFPSLIQPWLVNQLVQILKHGGLNTILARRSETKVYSADIDRYQLLKLCHIVPEERGPLVGSLASALFSIEGSRRFLGGLCRLPYLFFRRDLSFKEKLYSVFLIPFFTLKNIDVVHSHSEMAGNKFFPVICALKKPLVITFHGLPPVGVKPISHQQRMRYTGYASLILVNTEFAKRQYESLGVDGKKIRILPQGINLDDFTFSSKPYPTGEVSVLTVGRFHPDKGQKYALKAVADLIAKGVKLRYRLVGSGPQRSELETLCDQYGISDCVEFYSGITDDNLRNIYEQSHVFILPSLKSKDGFHEETQGVVLQEAQAMGLIVIASKAGGIPECIDDGVSGFLVDDRSSDAIAETLQFIVDKPEWWEKYQQAGRQWVKNRYNIVDIGIKINSHYNSLIEP